jgi:hypothetical protein
MKICIIFRGHNYRLSDQTRRYIDILMCWNNIKSTILDDLTKNGYEYDVNFVTYPSEIIGLINKIIQPKNLIQIQCNSQSENMLHTIDFIHNYRNEYDRFIILRCDMMYRTPVTKWPKWNNNGIILTNKDVHWPTRKLYSDTIFIVDGNMIDIFAESVRYSTSRETAHLHYIGEYLFINNIDFHLMYENYYHMIDHPLQALASIEDTPDLNNPLPGIPVTDISQYNP